MSRCWIHWNGMRIVSYFVNIKIGCWKNTCFLATILIPIFFFLVTKKYEAWRLKASSCWYSLNISRSSCCLTRMRHVFVRWDTNIQEIPRRGGPIQTLRPRVPKPWVQPFWWSRDYVLVTPSYSCIQRFLFS